MIKIISITLFILFAYNVISQITLQVNSHPALQENEYLYVAGNFNNWNPADPAYKLNKNKEGKYSVTLNTTLHQIEYKFTGGSWDKGEGNADGSPRINRTLLYDGSAQTYYLDIASWATAKPKTSTSSRHVRLISESFKLPKLQRERAIWIYLPDDYELTKPRYPVLYLQDGQNLFDDALSYSGEWHIDETLDSLYGLSRLNFIVVGIANGGAERMNEYMPWKNEEYGGGDGDEYLEDIIHAIKPYIDSTYRTLPDNINTAIGGSSLGGLISLYALAKYPGVFSKGLIFSPAFQLNTEIYKFMASNPLQQHVKLVVIGGQNESPTYAEDMQRMEGILRKQIPGTSRLRWIIHPDGVHNESYWAKQFPVQIVWLMSGRS